MTGLLFEVYHRGVSLQSSLPNCLWALTAMSLRGGVQSHVAEVLKEGNDGSEDMSSEIIYCV